MFQNQPWCVRASAVIAATTLSIFAAPMEGSRAQASDFRLVAKAGQLWQLPPRQHSVMTESPLTRFEAYSLNNLGQVAFSASTADGYAVWSELSGRLAIARSGQVAPGLPIGTTFSSNSFYNSPTGAPSGPVPSVLKLDDAGRTAYAGLVDWPYPWSSTRAGGFWTEQAGQVALIAAEGTPAPLEFPGMYFYELSSMPYEWPSLPVMAPSPVGSEYFGVVAQLGAIGSSGPVVESSLWVMGPAGPRSIVRYPRTSAVTALAVNRAGNAAYTIDNREIFSEFGGTVERIADASTLVPGVPTTARFATYHDLKSNDSGVLAFAGNIYGTGIGSSNNAGLYAFEGGSFRSIVREQDAVPGFPEIIPGVPGARFSDINLAASPFKLWAVGANGEVVFSSKITGSAVPASWLDTLWIDRAGSLELVVSQRDVMPGLPEGYCLADGPLGFSNVIMNSEGVLVVEAAIKNAAGASAGWGIWAKRSNDQEFTPIIYTGEIVQLPDGTSDVVSTVKLGELNDRGQILLQAKIGVDALLVSNAVATLSDFNGDLKVDGDDLAEWTQGFGAIDATHADGDADGDGFVDGADFLRWQREVSRGDQPSDVGSVPEPSAMALSLFALLAVRVSRRRCR